MLRKDRYPELPPTYSYWQEGHRIYISYVENGLRMSMRKSHSRDLQYWMKPEAAALAAWMHAYAQLKEKVR